MLKFTTENVEAAVIEFYKHQGKVNRECHEWLKGCQASPEAWQVVWPLLEPDKLIQVQFVAANMLHYKVSRCMHEVPDSEYPGLKERLISSLAKYICGPNVVLTRLSLTLGAFVTNSIGSFWSNPLEDLVAVFSEQNFPGIPQHTVLKLLVQIFGFIPEQAQSQWQLQVRKGQAHRELQAKGQLMYNWLFNIIRSQPNIELQVETLKAMSSWMKMLSVCEWSDLSTFVDILVSTCASSVVSEEDSLCETTLEILSGICSDPNAHSFPTVMLMVLDKILPLQSSLEIIKARDDMELASSIFGMYLAWADTHSKLIVEVSDPESSHCQANIKNHENGIALIKLLLCCSDYPGTYPVDEIVSSLTVAVWYSLVEDIQHTQSEALKYARIMNVFDDAYKNLGEILVRKGRYPLNYSEWNADEKEHFRVYRQDICDCVTYCFELRGWSLLYELVDWTEGFVQTIENEPDKLRLHWVDLESLLTAVKAVAENVSDEMDPLLLTPMSRLFAVIIRILQLKGDGISLLYQAAIECISSCSGMLQNYDSMAKSFLGYILEGLFQPEIATSSALALKTLSRECSRQLTEFTPQILSSCKLALDSGNLIPNDCMRVVYSIGKFLPYLPGEQIITAVNEIFAPVLTQLQNISNQQPQMEVKAQLVGLLNIISTLCSSIDNACSDDDDSEEDVAANNNYSSRALAAIGTNRAQPLIPVIEQIVPILVPLAEKWAVDEDVMEALFAILRHTLSTINSSSPLVLQHCIQLVLISYRIHPLTASTALAKQTIFMLGKENLNMQSQLLSEMNRLCLEKLRRTTDHDFTESYHQLLAQLLQHNHELVNASAISLDMLLQIAIESLTCAETSRLKASIAFLTSAVDKSSVLRPSLTEFFKSHGSNIFHKILVSLGYSVSRQHCHNFAELILSVNHAFPLETRRWLSALFEAPGFPSVHATNDAKNKFYTIIVRERVNKRAIQEAIQDFAIACRNLSGTEYAASTSRKFY